MGGPLKPKLRQDLIRRNWQSNPGVGSGTKQLLDRAACSTGLGVPLQRRKPCGDCPPRPGPLAGAALRARRSAARGCYFGLHTHPTSTQPKPRSGPCVLGARTGCGTAQAGLQPRTCWGPPTPAHCRASRPGVVRVQRTFPPGAAAVRPSHGQRRTRPAGPRGRAAGSAAAGRRSGGPRGWAAPPIAIISGPLPNAASTERRAFDSTSSAEEMLGLPSSRLARAGDAKVGRANESLAPGSVGSRGPSSHGLRDPHPARAPSRADLRAWRLPARRSGPW
jgi:hypothetical protein